MSEEQEKEDSYCSNVACDLRSICERFFDPLRKNQPLETTNLKSYNSEVDECFIQRSILSGEPATQRKWSREGRRR